MAQVIWTDSALADLARVFDYIARETQSDDQAEAFCLEIMETARSRLSLLPDSGALVEELREYGARELYKHGYRIIYIRSGDGCFVRQCIHSSRDLARQLDPDHWPGRSNSDEA